MVIRDAVAGDAAAIAAIYNASILAGDATMDQRPHTADDVLRWLATLSEREALLVLDAGDRLLGWGIVRRYSDRPGYRFTCETSLYLDRAFRGRGLGTRLQTALMDRCRTLGYHHIVAKIWASNTASLALHRKLGFEPVGVQREIGHCDGRWIDVVILQCLLPLPPSVAR
ncbi:MAG: N-acetyltransferase family protein [Bacteroidetes bacterium]|nr:MAG: N-acetyltransferase family protein [Bacteroidota bacterium]